MAAQESVEDVDDLALTDRDLVSLYLHYPEMYCAIDGDDDGDDATEGQDGGSDVFSPPASCSLTDSTAQTTPVRSEWEEDIPEEFEEYYALWQLFRTVDLPPHTITYYASLGRRMLRIGWLMFSFGGYSCNRSSSSEVLEHCQVLIALFRFSCSKIDEEQSNLSYIKSLAPFNVTPRAKDLWTNYRQRLELMIKHTKLPCREEREIIEALVRLFDAHVYNSVLKASAEHRVDTTIKSSLDQICDTLMTLARKYRQWFQSMRNTQAKYLQSNLLSILADQELLREIEEMVDIKTAAKNSIRDTKTLVCLQPSENTLDHLRYVLKMRELRAARRGASGRS